MNIALERRLDAFFAEKPEPKSRIKDSFLEALNGYPNTGERASPSPLRLGGAPKLSINTIERELIVLEYLEHIKTKKPALFRKLVQRKVYPSEFERGHYAHMKAQEEARKNHLLALKLAFDPSISASFIPSINERSRLLASKSASTLLLPKSARAKSKNRFEELHEKKNNPSTPQHLRPSRSFNPVSFERNLASMYRWEEDRKRIQVQKNLEKLKEDDNPSKHTLADRRQRSKSPFTTTSQKSTRPFTYRL